MADEEAQILAAAKKLPLDERVEHKNWKVRSEAYEDIRTGCERAFSKSDPILGQAGKSNGFVGAILRYYTQ